MNDAVIATKALTRRYRSHTALNEVTFRVPAGAVYALVGPNGAGKTTLIQVLMNLLPATSGEAQILGEPSSALRGAALSRIGYVSESQEMPDAMTVKAYLDFVRPFYPAWDAALEQQLLAEFGLPLDRKLKQLSRGMRMKVAFVSVLSYRPELLVLDEPFSGLDPLVREELIQGLLDRIGETTLFLSSHDLGEIEGFASHVGYLEQGSLMFSEELTTLSGRFRQLQFRSGLAELPPSLPGSWLGVEQSGPFVKSTETAFTGAAEAQALVSRFFPEATELTIEPMSLRSIFLATAKSQREQRVKAQTGVGL